MPLSFHYDMITGLRVTQTVDMKLIFSMIELLLRLAQRVKSDYRSQLRSFSEKGKNSL